MIINIDEIGTDFHRQYTGEGVPRFGETIMIQEKPFPTFIVKKVQYSYENSNTFVNLEVERVKID